MGKDCGSECDQVLADVWLFLDNELDLNARAAVRQHLDDCSPCLQQAGLEEKLKRLVYRGCQGEQAPPELRERLLTALSARRVTGVDPRTGGVVSVQEVELIQQRVVRPAHREAAGLADPPATSDRPTTVGPADEKER